MAFTLFCYEEPWTQRNARIALEHARTVLLLNNDGRRLLLELSFREDRALADVQWQWVDPAGIPQQDVPRLKQAAETLRARRVTTAKQQRGKIGRNQLCPCGSGKKYKRCCLNKEH